MQESLKRLDSLTILNNDICSPMVINYRDSIASCSYKAHREDKFFSTACSTKKDFICVLNPNYNVHKPVNLLKSFINLISKS